MLNSTRFRLSALVAAVATSLCIAAAPASAQQQEGLVNIVVSDVTVQVPVSVAANLCDVNVLVLATQERTGGAECTADAVSIASAGPGDQSGSADQGGIAQDGLINVVITDVVAQIPISVAANICDVNVGVLAEQLRVGDTTCQADAVSLAWAPPVGG
jgi:hypothetical protein